MLGTCDDRECFSEYCGLSSKLSQLVTRIAELFGISLGQWQPVDSHGKEVQR